MATRFSQIETARVDSFEAAERVRRSHQQAIDELRAEVRRLEAMPRCVGIAHFSKTSSESLAAETPISPGTLDLNTAPDLISFDDADTITLAGGYTYRLVASLYVSGAADVATTQWRDVTGAAYIGVRGYSPSIDGAPADAAQHLASALFYTRTARQVEIWCRSLAGTPSAGGGGATYSWLTVEAFK